MAPPALNLNGMDASLSIVQSGIVPRKRQICCERIRKRYCFAVKNRSRYPKALGFARSPALICDAIVPSKFLCRKRKSDYPFDSRKHIQNSTLQVYYPRNRLLDRVKILTTTQLYMLYNLCVISRYKTQACVVALRIVKYCLKCFLAHNPNNPKKKNCKLFFFQKTCRTE